MSDCAIFSMGYIKDGTFDPLSVFSPVERFRSHLASFVVTHRFDIEDFPKLYAKFQARKGGVEKVSISCS